MNVEAPQKDDDKTYNINDTRTGYEPVFCPEEHLKLGGAETTLLPGTAVHIVLRANGRILLQTIAQPFFHLWADRELLAPTKKKKHAPEN